MIFKKSFEVRVITWQNFWTWISWLFTQNLLSFHCLRINYKEVGYLADPKIPSLNSLGRDLIYHLGFFSNWYANFLIFPFDWYFFVMSISVFLLANMNFRRRSICLLKYVPRDIGPCLCSHSRLCPDNHTANSAFRHRA